MRILLYQHQSSDNHGCEALVYTISNQIKERYPDSFVELASNFSEHDKRFEFPDVDRIVQSDTWLKRFTLPWLVYQIDKRTFRSKAVQNRFMYSKQCYSYAKNNDVIVAIGGDTYCYNQGREHWALDRKIKALGKPMILWGCSLEPKEIAGEMAEHLSNFDIIAPRESITYEALKSANVDSKIVLCSDSAFNLPIKECDLPQGFEEGKMIGLNFSPMVMGSIKPKDRQELRASINGLIEHILKSTDQKIVLIPHVRLYFSDDITELRPIYEKWKDSGRVLLVDDDKLCASQLKYIISKCNVFVGARTHATIAAYSTAVPTLAIGYSVKARGIAKDLFSSENNMVVQIAELKDKEKFIKAFDYIYENRDDLKGRLSKIMPEYRERAYNSVKALQGLLGEK